MSRLVDHLLGRGREEPERMQTREQLREVARELIEEYSEFANRCIHCKICDQVFTSYDIFYDHRMASDADVAREGEDEFKHFQYLSSGEKFPDGVTVGHLEPCEPRDTEVDR